MIKKLQNENIKMDQFIIEFHDWLCCLKQFLKNSKEIKFITENQLNLFMHLKKEGNKLLDIATIYSATLIILLKDLEDEIELD